MSALSDVATFVVWSLVIKLIWACVESVGRRDALAPCAFALERLWKGATAPRASALERLCSFGVIRYLNGLGVIRCLNVRQIYLGMR